MTPTDTPEYRRLALASSNDMMRYDTRWALGEYADARGHVLDAAAARAEMGRIKADAGEFAHAAEDWLSAAECYFLGGEPARMAAAVGRVRELDRAGRIPDDRTDLRAALRERDTQFRGLLAATLPPARTAAPDRAVPAPQP